MFKCHQIKPDHSPLKKNKVNIYGSPVFAPDYSLTCLVAKRWTNYQWALHIRILYYDNYAVMKPQISTVNRHL